MAVTGGGGSKARYNGQGKMRFGQGKVREFHFRLRVISQFNKTIVLM